MEENLKSFLDQRVSHQLRLKALREDPTYIALLKEHRAAVQALRDAETKRYKLWGEICRRRYEPYDLQTKQG